MDLIERYIYDVSRRLPRRQRGDIEKELRSSLHDALDAAAPGESDASDDRVVELLRQFGPPAQLAASYRTGPSYLVGPELYPAFLKTIKVVITIIVVILAIAVVGDAIDEPSPFLEIVKGFATSNLIGDIIHAMGWVVLVFWIIQLTSKSQASTVAPDTGRGPHAATDAWDPHTLPKHDDPDRIGHTGVKVEIAIMIGLVVLFAVFPNAIGATVSTNGERHWVSLLGPGFLERRGLLYVGFVATVILNFMVLRHDRWTVPTRVFELAISGIFIVALVPMATGGNIIANDPADLVASGWSPSAAESLSNTVFPVLDKIMRLVFAGIIIGMAWSAVTRMVALVRRVAS